MNRRWRAIAFAIIVVGGLVAWDIHGRTEKQLLAGACKLVLVRKAKLPFENYVWANEHTLYYVDKNSQRVHRIDCDRKTDEVDTALTTSVASGKGRHRIAATSPDGRWLLFTSTMNVANGTTLFGTVSWSVVPTIGGKLVEHLVDSKGGAEFNGQALCRRSGSEFVIPVHKLSDSVHSAWLFVDTGVKSPRLTASVLKGGDECLIGESRDGHLISCKRGGVWGNRLAAQFHRLDTGDPTRWYVESVRFPERRTEFVRSLCTLSPEGNRLLWVIEEEARSRRPGWIERLFARVGVRPPPQLSPPRIMVWTSMPDGSKPILLGAYPLRLQDNLLPNLMGLQAKWTPDGRNISFVHEGDLYIVPAM